MAKKTKKLTFAVSKALATTGIVMALGACGPEISVNPAPPDDGCCVNPAPDFGPTDTGDAGHDMGDDGGDAATADAEQADAEIDATSDDAGTDAAGDVGDTGTD